MTLDWSAFYSLQATLDQCRLHSRSPCYPPRCSLPLASPLPSRSARPAEGRGRRTSLPVVFGSLTWKWAAQSLKRDAASFCGLPGVNGQHTPHYNSPACFACSTVASEGSKRSSAVLSSSLVCQVWLQRKWCWTQAGGVCRVAAAGCPFFILRVLLNPLWLWVYPVSFRAVITVTRRALFHTDQAAPRSRTGSRAAWRRPCGNRPVTGLPSLPITFFQLLPKWTACSSL